LRHCAAHLKVRSAALLVGSTPSWRREGEELLTVCQQSDRRIAYVFIAAVCVAVRQSEELLLRRNGFGDRLFARDRAVSDAGSGAEPMPQAEQTRMQSRSVAAEPLRLRCFGDPRYAQDVAFEMRPAELPFTFVGVDQDIALLR
jgi:hypothetical protein